MVRTFLLLCILLSNSAISQPLKLTSLDWPPFSGKSLDNGGTFVTKVKQAFAQQGIDVSIDFYPWSRAVWLSKQHDTAYMGYLPEYAYQSDTFLFSDPVDTSPLVLIHPKGKIFHYDKPQDLLGKRVGVVQDYVNTAEIDVLIAKRKIISEVVTTDAVNIRKVAAGRLDAAIIDVNVYHYLIKHDASLKGLDDLIDINPSIVEMKPLYVAFNKNKDGEKWLSLFNQGLQQLSPSQIQ